MSGSRRADREVYERQGFGRSLGIEGKIGLLIVDFVNGFADPAVFGGGNIASAIAQTADVLGAARQRGWPVAHSRIDGGRSEEHTSELQSLMRISYAVLCFKQRKKVRH